MKFITDESLKRLKTGDVDGAYKLLKKAESLTIPGKYTDSQEPRIDLLNHIGCCLRRQSKNELALQTFNEALKASKISKNPEMTAKTSLNLCSMYRQVDNHKMVRFGLKVGVGDGKEGIQRLLASLDFTQS